MPLAWAGSACGANDCLPIPADGSATASARARCSPWVRFCSARSLLVLAREPVGAVGGRRLSRARTGDGAVRGFGSPRRGRAAVGAARDGPSATRRRWPGSPRCRPGSRFGALFQRAGGPTALEGERRCDGALTRALAPVDPGSELRGLEVGRTEGLEGLRVVRPSRPSRPSDLDDEMSGALRTRSLVRITAAASPPWADSSSAPPSPTRSRARAADRARRSRPSGVCSTSMSGVTPSFSTMNPFSGVQIARFGAT